MTPETCPEYAMRATFDASRFHIYNEQTTREDHMSWLHDPEKDEYFSRVDEELTAAGYTATPRGRALRDGILILWVLACLAAIWWLV